MAIKKKPELDSLIQKFYSAPNEKLKDFYRKMILKINPKWREIK